MTTTAMTDTTRRGHFLPALVLFLLSPWIAEVLFGATPASNLGGLLVVGPLYGAGALLIRELARRRGWGWTPIILLGAAYAIVEEGFAIQSISNANMFNSGLLGGRFLGVNWVWSEWTIGYHIVWSISIPILLSELLFPAERNQLWLGRISLSLVGLLYLLAAIALCAIFRFAVTPDYRTPTPILIGEGIVIVLLVVLALRWPRGEAPVLTFERTPTAKLHHIPPPWQIGLLALLSAVLWFALLDLPHPLRVGALVLLPMLFDLLWAGGLVALIRRWSSQGQAWSELHQLALILGALLISILWGFFFVTASNRFDRLFLGSASLLTLVLLSLFAIRLQRRDSVVAQVSEEQMRETGRPIIR